MNPHERNNQRSESQKRADHKYYEDNKAEIISKNSQYWQEKKDELNKKRREAYAKKKEQNLKNQSQQYPVESTPIYNQSPIFGGCSFIPQNKPKKKNSPEPAVSQPTFQTEHITFENPIGQIPLFFNQPNPYQQVPINIFHDSNHYVGDNAKPHNFNAITMNVTNNYYYGICSLFLGYVISFTW